MAEYDPPQPLWKRNLAGILDFVLAMIVFGILSTKIFGPSKLPPFISQNPNTSAVGLSGWALVVTLLFTVAYFAVLGGTGGTVFQRLFKMKRRAVGLFFYGWAERNGERVRVDVLPPAHLRRGDIELKGQGKPDLKAWVIFVDREELARVERREDVAATLLEASVRPRGLLSRVRGLLGGR